MRETINRALVDAEEAGNIGRSPELFRVPTQCTLRPAEDRPVATDARGSVGIGEAEDPRVESWFQNPWSTLVCGGVRIRKRRESVLREARFLFPPWVGGV